MQKISGARLVLFMLVLAACLSLMLIGAFGAVSWLYAQLVGTIIVSGCIVLGLTIVSALLVYLLLRCLFKLGGVK